MGVAKAAQKIEEIDSASTELASRMAQSRPLVIRGLVSNWPAVAAARQSNEAVADYLSGMASDEPVTVYTGGSETDGRVFYNEDLSGFNFTPSHASLASVLDQLNQEQADPLSPLIYVGSTMIERWLPTFVEQNPMPLAPAESLKSIWIGNRSRIAAHFDFPDNLACVVSGKRRFTLFPPDQVDNLYVGPVDHTPAGQAISLVDFNNPDLARFPRFSQALEHAMTAELGPGDALFIPSMWWHHVESQQALNILVNYWWRSSPYYLGNPTIALQHALLSIAHLPKEQKQAWQHMFDYWVFNTDADRDRHIPADKRGILGDIDELAARKIRAELLNKLNR